MKKVVLFISVLVMLFCCALCLAEEKPTISFDAESYSVAVGKSIKLKTTITPRSKVKLEWSSSDEGIATVAPNGAVKGLSAGETVITVKAVDDPEISASCKVTVVIPVNKITVSDPKIILAPDTTWIQNFTVEPADATVKDLEWSSSKESVATVDENGVITGVAVGNCKIIATAKDGSKKKVVVSVQVGKFDVVIAEPGEVTVDFPTRGGWTGSMIMIGSFVMEESEETVVNFKNGVVCEGSAEHTLRPIKAGTEIVEVVKKHNRKVTGRQKYKVYVAQNAAVAESDDEIGCLPAESYEGHTYQVFYSGRSWDEAETFCERHGGHLVTITTENEQEFVENYLAKAEKMESYWIGLNSGKGKSFKTWITKEKISYTKWAEGNPDRNDKYSCGRIAASTYADNNDWTMERGTWDDESNHYIYINGFICEWDDENAAQPVEPKITTDQEDNNDEDVQETEEEAVS